MPWKNLWRHNFWWCLGIYFQSSTVAISLFSLAVQLFSRDERHVVIIGDKKFQADAGQDAGLGKSSKGGRGSQETELNKGQEVSPYEKCHKILAVIQKSWVEGGLVPKKSLFSKEMESRTFRMLTFFISLFGAATPTLSSPGHHSRWTRRNCWTPNPEPRRWGAAFFFPRWGSAKVKDVASFFLRRFYSLYMHIIHTYIYIYVYIRTYILYIYICELYVYMIHDCEAIGCIYQ